VVDVDAADEISRLKDRLLGRAPNSQGVGCNLCGWILTDLAKHGALTSKVPEPTFDGKATFPIEGKLRHIYLEGFWTKGLKELFSVKS
jgi:hypothetical protein